MSLRWALGHATVSTATILFRGTESGTLVVTHAGGRETAAVDTSVNDGTALITLRNLSGPTAWTATLGSLSASGTARPMPAAAPFRVAWLSCVQLNYVCPGERIMTRNPVAVFHLGDEPYPEANTTYHQTIDGLNTDDSTENAYTWHRAIVLGDFPGYEPLNHGAPNYRQPDDHEFAGNDDWDHSVANAVGIPAAIPAAPTQAEIDAHWAQINAARIVYHGGNPSGTYPTAVAQKPGEADAATPASNYPPLYFKVTIGPATFFHLDCISHRDAVADTDDASKSMLGTEQLAQLQAALAACTTTFKVIVSGKMTYPHPQKNGNQDSWRAYTTERNALLAWIDANITGCLWIVGDQHYPHVASLTQAVDGIDHVAVCACPAGVQMNDQIPTTGRDEICWTYGVSDEKGDRYWGELLVTDDYIQAEIYRARRGERVWCGRVAAGSNALSYPSSRY